MPEEVKIIRKRKEWRSDYAQESYKLFKDYKSHSRTWRSNAIRMENARFGRQYSNAETKELLAFRQAPLPISVSTAICDTADAMTISAKPVINVAPLIHPYDDTYTKQSRKVAGIFKHLIQKSWYDSLGNLQFDRAVFDSTNVGHGLLYAVPRSEFGEFEVDVKHLSWRYFFGDPSSVDPLYQDMDAMIYAMNISKKAAYRFVKSIEEDINYKEFEENFCKGGFAEEGTFDEDDTYIRRSTKENDDVLFMQRLTLEEDNAYLIIPRRQINRNAEAADFKYRTSTQLTSDLLQREAEGEIKIEKVSKIFLTEYTSIGNYGYKVVYPITKYNIVPLVYDHRDTPYPYSRMWYLYPLQRALNKFMMTSILNASLMNSTRVLAEEGSIVNMKEWITSASMPGVVLRYRLPVPGYSTPPQVVNPQPMHEAWLTMPRFLTYMMEYISGIFSTMQGNPEGAPDVFSTVASLQSAGGQKIKRRMAKADATLSVLGEVVGEFYKEYAPINGFSTNVRALDSEEEIVKYNELRIVREDNNDPTKRKLEIDPNTDLRRGFRKVRFTSTGSNGYESATEAAMLTTLATQLGVRELVPAILERINVSGLDEVTKNMKDRENLIGQINQLQEMVKNLEGESKQKENQIISLVRRLEAAKAKGQFDVELQKFKDNPEAYIESATNNQGER